MTMTIRKTSVRFLAVSLLIAAGSLPIGGCVGYSTYPAMQGAGGGKNPNVGDVFENAAFALKWAIQYYPPGRATASTTETYAAPNRPSVEGITTTPVVAISFLPGMRRETCLRMIELIGPAATALTPETANLPTYYVSSVDVLGDTGRVTIHRPAGSDALGQQMYQGISIRLRGGLQRWKVESHRVWDVTTVSIPEAVYLPDRAYTGTYPQLPPTIEAPVEEPATPVEGGESNGNAEVPAGTP